MTWIPRAARVALWLNAWLRGDAAPDDVLDALGADVHHVFLGFADHPLGAAAALGAIRGLASSVSLALTAPGDPVGLAGPPAFNTAALDAGEALVFSDAGVGVVPVRVGGALEWRCMPAQTPPPLDPREARFTLRTTLREITEDLVRWDIATWNNEIPDLLMNRTEHLEVPTAVTSADREAVTSASLCLGIVEAARAVEPGALTARERSDFESAMRRLDSAARRALVAVCGAGSDNLTSP